MRVELDEPQCAALAPGERAPAGAAPGVHEAAAIRPAAAIRVGEQ